MGSQYASTVSTTPRTPRSSGWNSPSQRQPHPGRSFGAVTMAIVTTGFRRGEALELR